MTASFPTSIKAFVQKVTGISYIDAPDINQAYDEIEAIETYLSNISAKVYQLSAWAEDDLEFASTFVSDKGRQPLNGELAFCFDGGSGLRLEIYVTGAGWRVLFTV